MNTGQKPPIPPTDEDPWDALARVRREASAAARGVDPDIESLGDTAQTMASAHNVAGEDAPSNEILDLVNASLASEPERSDLWMMRFDVLKTLGMKDDFGKAIVEGWKHPRLGQSLDWVQIRKMWETLAPNEPVPGGIKLPTASVAVANAPITTKSGFTRQRRRFSDTAMRTAGAELAILGKAYAAVRSRPDFMTRFSSELGPLVRRPTPLEFAEKITRSWGGKARVFFKREDLRKVTAEGEYALAQAWLGMQLRHRSLVTGNDVDSHSTGLAIAAQRFGLKCTITVKRSDLGQKADLIERLRKLGATVVAPDDSTPDDEDPRLHALSLWQKSKGSTHLALSLGSGPGAYPTMVNDFQSLLGLEVSSQIKANSGGDAPLTLIASVGSESDSIGFVLPFLNESNVELVFAEPEPGGIASWRPSQRLKLYNGSRREHCWLHATGRITHIAVSDSQAMSMQQLLSSLEDVHLSFEDARAMAVAALLLPRSVGPHNYIVLAG